MKKTILIIDDSAPLRLVLNEILQTAGFDTLQAEDATSALGLLDGRKVHLLICDLYMPDLDGLTLLQKVRTIPSYRFTPVIMLSTEKSEEFKDKAYNAGAKAWVTKPFSPQQMLNAVARLISVE
ncbi:response regulator [Rheinheimera texasensis]|uniref:response regulator n=1 Tax=Rheinheimera texasensis TaxID=306205 RepID=UPI0004E15A13|nr:response regulator [Rheinheimera texasensis]